MKRTIFIAYSILLLFYSAAYAGPDYYVSLHTPGETPTMINSVFVDQYEIYEVWIWVNPGDDGLKGFEFRIETDGDICLSHNNHPDLLAIGDPTSEEGWAGAFTNCKHDWVWLSKLHLFCDNPNPHDITIVEYPATGSIEAAKCLDQYPVVDMYADFFTVNYSNDTTPPWIESISVLNLSSLDVVFSERVTSFSAQQPGNYLIEEMGIPGEPLVVDSVLSGPDSSSVTLALADPLEQGIKYRICTDGICDMARNCSICESWAWKIFGSLAELEVQLVSTEPDSLVPSETHMQASFICRNTGDINSGPFQVEIDFSRSGLPGATVDQFYHTGLDPGESNVLDRDFDIPLEKGSSNSIIVTLDTADEVPELNENNMVSREIYTYHPSVGVDVESFAISNDVIMDCCTPVEFSFYLVNGGTWPSEPMTGYVGVGDYGWGDDSTTIEWVCPYYVPALEPGDSIFITTSDVITQNLVCGYNDIWFDHDWGLYSAGDCLLNYTPGIMEIKDIPDDSGGFVSLTFSRSAADDDGLNNVVTHYRIMRRVDAQVAGILSAVSSDPDSSCFATEEWEQIQLVDADFSDTYTVTLPTHADSTAGEEECWSTYRVIADRPELSYYSCPDSGYSLSDVTATFLESYDAYFADRAIMVEWNLHGEGPENGFSVMKAEGNNLFKVLGQGVSRDDSGSYILIDSNILSGRIYRYRIVYSEQGRDLILFETEDIKTPSIPTSLSQNNPNPFNPSTTIEYYISSPSRVTLAVFDVNGRLVRKLVSNSMQSGSYSVKWDGRSDKGALQASGVYFCRLRAGSGNITRKMILLR